MRSEIYINPHSPLSRLRISDLPEEGMPDDAPTPSRNPRNISLTAHPLILRPQLLLRALGGLRRDLPGVPEPEDAHLPQPSAEALASCGGAMLRPTVDMVGEPWR